MRYKVTIEFDLDDDDFINDPQDHHEVETFITDALESWGGQRHPDDWLFHSLQKVKLSQIKKVEKK